MSAEVLRRAASELREDARLFDNRDSDFCVAVAEWLDATAARIDMGKPRKGGVLPGRNNHSWRGSKQALAVARAYLGEQS